MYFPLLQQGHLQTLAGDQLLHGHPREPDVGIGKLAWAVWCPTPLSSAQQHLKAAQQTGYSYISCRILHKEGGCSHGNVPANTVVKLSRRRKSPILQYSVYLKSWLRLKPIFAIKSKRRYKISRDRKKKRENTPTKRNDGCHWFAPVEITALLLLMDFTEVNLS